MRIFIIIFFITSSFLISAQKSFKMIFSSTGYDNGVAAFRTTNDDYIIIGNTSEYGYGGNDIWVIALDSNAGFKWQKTYGSPENDLATSAIITSDNHILISGNVTTYYPPSVDNFVLYLDSSGYPLLHKIFGGIDWDFATSVEEYGDSIFLVGGYTYNGPNQGNINPIITAITKSGNIAWTSFAGSGAEEENRSIEIGENNEIFISGATLNSDQRADSAFVKQLDSVGNLVWYSTMPTYKGELYSLISYEDTLIAATGFHYDSTGIWREPLIAKIDYSGDWVLVADEYHGADSYYSYITKDSLGNMIVSGMSTKHTHGMRDIYFGSFETHGWWTKSNILGGYKDDDPGNIQYHHVDSSFLVCGTTKSLGVPFSGIMLCQTRFDMVYDTVTVMMLVSEINKTDIDPIPIKVYPNPGVDFVIIEADLKQVNQMEIFIYDQQGQLVKKEEIGNSQQKIDISQWPSGQYFIQLISNNQKAVIEFIKIDN